MIGYTQWDKLSRGDIQRLVKKVTNAIPSDFSGKQDEYGKTPLLPVASKEDIKYLEKVVDNLTQRVTDQGMLINKLIALTPAAFTVKKFKSSERPPEELFKVVNNLTGSFGYGATEDEAKRKAQ